MQFSKLVSLNYLQIYHKSLIKYLQKGELIPANICSRCGGILNEDNKCPYCRTKFKLVVDSDSKERE